MKRTVILLMVLLVLLSSVQPSMAYTYYTDILGHWGERDIDWATNDAGLFEGYDDNTFRPENSITRAEFITILNRLLKVQTIGYSNTHSNFKLDYNDLPQSFWAYDDIYNIAYHVGNQAHKKVDLKLIFPGNSFRPNTPITRYEAGVLTSLIMPPPIKTLNNNYKDLSSNLTFYKEIMELTSNGIVQGYHDNTFRPGNNITRAEAVTIIKNAYKELEYIKTDQLYIRDLEEFNLSEKKPLFEYGTGANAERDLDKKFIEAITTLEYISFVGHIPHAEQHLYDMNAIDTLWNLKNDDYYNIIGVNYYLLYYDNSLVKERKMELVREAFEHYKKTMPSKNINGMINLIQLSNNTINSKELISFLEDYINFSKDNNEKILATTILAEKYLINGQTKKALDIYKGTVHLSDDINLKTHLILNNAYLTYKNGGATLAIKYLNDSWNALKTNSQYQIHKNKIDFLFTSMIKQLMLK